MARRLVLWALLLTTTLGVLGAEDWRVAIVSLSPRGDLLLPLVSESAERFGPRLVATESRLGRYQEKQRREAIAAYHTERARLYQGGDARLIESLQQPQIGTVELPNHITYETFGYERSRSELLFSGEQATRWYLRRQGLDALITVDVQELDIFDRVIVTVFEGEGVPLIDRVVERGSFHLLKDALAGAMLSYSGARQSAALLVEGGPPSLRISLDTVLQPLGESLFIRPAGTLALSLSSPSHLPEERTVTLVGGEVTVVDGQLKAEEGGPITLHSKSGAVNWFVDGVAQGRSVTLGLENVRYPLSVLATKEGFASHQAAFPTAPDSSVAITMEGEVTRASALLEREQEDFYKALRSTILLFGAYVATLALGSTAGFESEFWPIAQVASGGMAMVNLVSFITQLAAYGR